MSDRISESLTRRLGNQKPSYAIKGKWNCLKLTRTKLERLIKKEPSEKLSTTNLAKLPGVERRTKKIYCGEESMISDGA